MIEESSEDRDQLARAAAGDQEALRPLFSRYRDRLKRMVHLRLSRRLSGRVDDSDVVQEAFLEISQKFPEYARAPELPSAPEPSGWLLLSGPNRPDCSKEPSHLIR